MGENKMFFEEFGREIELAAQEWGIKEGLRLFGFDEFYTETPFLRGYFIDPGYKTLSMTCFALKETKGKITLAKAKANQLSRFDDKEKSTGFKWPVKIMRTKNFVTKNISPVNPLYEALVNRGIILPFQSMMKQKDWQSLPFEGGEGLKPTAI